MFRLFFLFITLLAMSFNPVFAQQAFTLFQTNQDTEVTRSTDDAELLGLRPDNIRKASIEVDFSALQQAQFSKESLLEVSLFDGRSASFEVKRTPSYNNETESIISYATNNERAYMLASWKDDRFIANVLDYETNVFYAIRYDTESGEHVIREMDPVMMNHLACGTADLPEVTEALELAWQNHPVFKGAARMLPDIPEINGVALSDFRTEIDIMLIYTPLAALWSEENEGGIEVSVSLMMAMSQLAMDLSEVNLDFRLVALKELDYDETGVSSGDHLRRMTASTTYNPWGPEFDGFLLEVHDWRDFYGADLVALLAFVSDTGGIAWLLTDPSGNANIGFSLNRIQQLTTSFTLVHEIGHNMGSHHGRNQNTQAAPPQGALFEYSTGWRFNGTDGTSYATVMNYNEGSLPAPVFSNPNVDWAGTPSGSYEGVGAPADNAASLNFSKMLVADYRISFEDGPEFSVDESINITLEEGQTEEISFQIQNTGETWLNWFGRVESDASIYGNGDVIYATDFSADDGFTSGFHTSLNGWDIFTGGSHQFRITGINPSTGEQHLRIPKQSNWVGLSSPFFHGTEGAREFSFDVDVKENPNFRVQIPNGDEIIRIYFRANRFQLELLKRNEENTEWVRISNYDYRFDFTRESYKNAQLVFLPEFNEMIMRFGGSEIFRKSFEETELQTPDRLILYYNAGNNANLAADLDNFQILTFDKSNEWMSPLSVSAGSLDLMDTQEVTFTVRTEGLEPGEYTKNLVFTSNDPNRRDFVVPVTLNLQAFTSVDDDESSLPYAFNLSQNYPNPFNPTTNIQFELPQAGTAELAVYNIQGQRVATLVDGSLSAGAHQVSFDASALSSGVYIYRLRSGNMVQSRKMMLIK